MDHKRTLNVWVYSTARQKFKQLLDDVKSSSAPIKIIRRDHDDAVIVMSEKYYDDLLANQCKSKKEG